MALAGALVRPLGEEERGSCEEEEKWRRLVGKTEKATVAPVFIGCRGRVAERGRLCLGVLTEVGRVASIHRLGRREHGWDRHGGGSFGFLLRAHPHAGLDGNGSGLASQQNAATQAQSPHIGSTGGQEHARCW